MHAHKQINSCIYIYMVILILLLIHTLLCVWRVYVLVEVGTTFSCIFEMERFWRSKGEGKVVTFSMYFERLKDVQRLVNCSHCWEEGKLGGSLRIYIYTKVQEYYYSSSSLGKESFQSKPSLQVFAQLNWTFVKKLWWSNGLHRVMPWRVACLWLALNQLS